MIHKLFNFSQTNLTPAESPVLIGLGMGRTGTTSLKLALETLLKRPCYHSSVVREQNPAHILTWQHIFQQLLADPQAEIIPEQIYSILDGFSASSGHPACALHRPLMEIYPKTKFVLGIRDSKSWLESLRATVLPKQGIKMPNQSSTLACFGAGFLQANTLSFRHSLGWDVDLDDDDVVMRAFEKRTEEIIKTIPSDRLLVYRIEQGWQPLCEFLQVPVPDLPFPWVNTREQFAAQWNSLLTEDC
ncbi:NAD dependent epimerase/dehydratase [Fasciola gigantica]|uniref:NAD dependent epimerase/dehydratase n=1 Tax=Fasciola gigantica TaxID=46835 RepID=A0A504YQK7_FASGI|nr:NAD dependent epimerase/dehydratase [Fasciola gigantica]